MMVGTVCLQEMGVVFVVSMPFTVSLFPCAMIDHSVFTNPHSQCLFAVFGKRFGVQHAMHGCECGNKAFM